jgi:hypothetical protein
MGRKSRAKRERWAHVDQLVKQALAGDQAALAVCLKNWPERIRFRQSPLPAILRTPASPANPAAGSAAA